MTVEYSAALSPGAREYLEARNTTFPSAARTNSAASAAYLGRLRTPVSRLVSERVAVIEDRQVPNGPAVRVYRPDVVGPLPIILFFHGGGWVMGDLEMHDATCRRLANGVPAVVVNVDYRLAPEHPYPAAHQDAVAALSWARAHAADLGGDVSRLVVAGTSAGGNIAASVALADSAPTGQAIALQVLIYAVLDSTMSSPSYREFASGYSLEAEQMAWFLDQYVPAGHDRLDPLISPTHVQSVAGSPPAVILTAGCDPLRDEAENYGARLSAAGVDVKLLQYPGQIHGFLSAYGVIEDAETATREICDAIEEQLRS